ncbi:MAG: endonuclease/exonuclease/phosphatase family protein [Caldilineaceae bacterium]
MLLLILPLTSFAQSEPTHVYLPLAVSGVTADAATDAAIYVDTDAASTNAFELAQFHADQSDRFIRVMTRNLYFGTDLTPLITAPDLNAFVVAASTAYQKALATDFPARAKAIASEIAATDPTFVGLQEAAIWRTGPAFDPAPATTVQVDFVQLILAELARRHASYKILVSAPGFDAESPTILGFDVRLSLQDVILVRTDSKTEDLKLSNIQTGRYTAILTLPSPAGAITFPRQWASVDAKLHGKSFRFVTTHLEAVAAPVRVAQAQELLAGPLQTALPVILVGDFNSEPNAAGDAAAVVLAGGLQDVWPVAHPSNPGFTCCQAEDLRNPTSQLNQRIDLVWTQGNLSVVDARLVGAKPSNRTASGVWPSDHAGVVATLALGK